MAGKKGAIIETRLNFKPGLAKKLEEMAQRRQMPMGRLLEELVEIGVVSLHREPERVDPWQNKDDGVQTFPVKI